MNERKGLDPRSPWVIGIHELVRRPGEIKHLERDLPAPAGMGLELIAVPEGSLIHVRLQLESVSEGVLVSGVVSADLVGQCARCLDEITDHRDFDLQELFYYPGRDAEEDALFIVDDRIDLEQPIRDAIVPELPFIPLCREDCFGLCPGCGFALNDDPDHNHGQDVDPRWLLLQGLADQDALDGANRDEGARLA